MKYSVLVVVALLVTLSGCPSGSGVSVNISAEMNVTDQGFRLDGQIQHEGLTRPTFSNVTLYLYRANGTIIKSRELGTLETSLAVEIRSDEIPEYVIVNSPEFWEYEEPDISYLEYWEETQSYGVYGVSSKSEFPVEVP